MVTLLSGDPFFPDHGFDYVPCCFGGLDVSGGLVGANRAPIVLVINCLTIVSNMKAFCVLSCKFESIATPPWLTNRYRPEAFDVLGGLEGAFRTLL